MPDKRLGRPFCFPCRCLLGGHRLFARTWGAACGFAWGWPGPAGGAAAFGRPGGPAGPPRPPNKRVRPGPLAPGALFQGALRPAAAPPETPGFSASPEKAFVLPLQLLANKTSGPLPMSGPPAHFAGNPEKFISWFPPLFFKSGGGGVGASSFPTGRRATALANCGRGLAAAL